MKEHVRTLTRRERLLAWLINHLSNWETSISDKQWEKHHGAVGAMRYPHLARAQEMADELKDRARDASQ